MEPGWPCVALSRVKTLKGVFLRKPLQRIKNGGMNRDVRKMLEKFEAEVDVTSIVNVVTPEEDVTSIVNVVTTDVDVTPMENVVTLDTE